MSPAPKNPPNTNPSAPPFVLTWCRDRAERYSPPHVLTAQTLEDAQAEACDVLAGRTFDGPGGSQGLEPVGKKWNAYEPDGPAVCPSFRRTFRGFEPWETAPSYDPSLGYKSTWQEGEPVAFYWSADLSTGGARSVRRRRALRGLLRRIRSTDLDYIHDRSGVYRASGHRPGTCRHCEQPCGPVVYLHDECALPARLSNGSGRDLVGAVSGWKRPWGFCVWCREEAGGRRQWHRDCTLQYLLARGRTRWVGGADFLDPGPCVQCGADGQEIDHELALCVARTQGRRALLRCVQLDNLRWLCHDCHAVKSGRDRRLARPPREPAPYHPREQELLPV